MRNRKIITAVCIAAVLTAAGCGKDKASTEVTPTPVPTAAPTPVPATATPLPTSTPAPRLIGEKTSTAKFVYLTNGTGKVLREIYVKISGGEEWGRNLIPTEASVKTSEQVQMYYAPSSEEEAALYDMKIVTDDAVVYEIYNADLEDMENAGLSVEEDSAYIRYMSVSAKKEKNTKGSSSDLEEENSDESDDSSSYSNQDDSSSDYNGDYDNSDDSNGDSGYEDDGDYGGDDGTDDSGDDTSGEDDTSGGDDTSGEDDASGDDDTSGGDEDGSSGGDIVWDENGNWTEN